MSSNQPSDNRRIIVFDVNETLLDIDALSPYFQHVFGDAKIMRQWFAELILYSQTLSLSGKYVEFGELAVDVLAMVAKIKHAALSEASIDEFKQVLRYLPPHPEVAECLQRLRAAGFRLVTLTNSAPSASKAALERAGLASYVEQQFSVGEVKRYKPALETYSMVSHALHVPTSALRMVAAHARQCWRGTPAPVRR